MVADWLEQVGCDSRLVRLPTLLIGVYGFEPPQ